MLSYFIREYFGSINFFSIALKPAIAAVGMGIILYFLQFSLGILLLIPTGITTYAIVFLLINGLNEHDKDIIMLLKQEAIRLVNQHIRYKTI